MSTEPQKPATNQPLPPTFTEPVAGRANLPAQHHEPPPADGTGLPAEGPRRLTQLANQANRAHELVKDAALRFCRHSVAAGMALLEAHDLCPAKSWGAWLQDHFEGSPRTARRYMKQAKMLLLLGVERTGVSVLHPEEVSRLFDRAIRRIERQGAVAAGPRESGTAGAVTIVSGRSDEIDAGRSAPLSIADPLVPVLALFNELMAALCGAIESGQQLDYGELVLDELDRIRREVDACRLLLCDARGPLVVKKEKIAMK